MWIHDEENDSDKRTWTWTPSDFKVVFNLGGRIVDFVFERNANVDAWVDLRDSE